MSAEVYAWVYKGVLIFCILILVIVNMYLCIARCRLLKEQEKRLDELKQLSGNGGSK